MVPDEVSRLAAFRAADSLWYAPGEPTPLRSVVVGSELAWERPHLRRHLQAGTLCRETELHGADYWNTALLTREALRYLS